MIGVINRDKIFEFRDEDNLLNALSWYGDRYGCDIIFVTDSTRDRKIQTIIYKGNYTFRPNLFDDTKYYIYGIPNTPSTTLDSIKSYQKNDFLPNIHWELDQHPFAFINQPVPKPLELY